MCTDTDESMTLVAAVFESFHSICFIEIPIGYTVGAAMTFLLYDTCK
jgi:hypothetical protein